MTIDELHEIIESEGDELIFKYKGYDCSIKRTKELGILCGYVKYKFPLSRRFIINIECHGGITYHKRGIIGFDCGHGFDIIPEHVELMQRMRELNEPSRMLEFEQYRTMQYVRSECESIVEQIIKHRRPWRKWVEHWKNS